MLLVYILWVSQVLVVHQELAEVQVQVEQAVHRELADQVVHQELAEAQVQVEQVVRQELADQADLQVHQDQVVHRELQVHLVHHLHGKVNGKRVPHIKSMMLLNIKVVHIVH
jgi:hypothetical protein